MKISKTLASYALLITALYFAIFEQVAGAQNVAVFLISGFTILWLFGASHTTQQKLFDDNANLDKFTYPTWFNIIKHHLNVAILVLLVWSGWWVCAVMFVLMTVFRSMFTTALEEEIKRRKAMDKWST